MPSYPFQKLCCVHPVNNPQPFLFAASGPLISSFDLKDGSVLSRWPNQDSTAREESSEEATGDGNRLNKRRKLDTEDSTCLSRQTSEDSIEIISERKKETRIKPKVESAQQPNISHLLATSDGTTVIAVMAEDKSVNVFEVQSEGTLKLQSKRCMPKRMCAVVLTPDEKTILVGDKFGDVYTLPLYPLADWVPRKSEEPATWTPSATELTVHTKGNLHALRQQREQRIHNPKKEGLEFEHKLLLGHVSLLTDVVIAEIQDGPRRKQYILTSDRDEHIRVSRGVSQAYIIEGYCLGHQDFVSCLSILPWDPKLLVAGSGEPSLKVFDWQSGRLLDDGLLQRDVQDDITTALAHNHEGRTINRLVVSGIWPIHHNVIQNSSCASQPPHILLVALEGLPILLSYMLDDGGKLLHHQTLALSGNVLDVGIRPAQWEVIVSLDTVHCLGSLKTFAPRETPALKMFESFKFPYISGSTAQLKDQVELQWESSSFAMQLNDAASKIERAEIPAEHATEVAGTYSALGEMLYGLENLRKKRWQELTNVDEEEPLEEAIVEAEAHVQPEQVNV
ncbi:uncharacterized protein A1O9_08722 [Exophiala aquamarina CBS 119918]|uniref:Uncharacterized protein n=1 Tax=Exophiala aquamarina CBS 119918 TaxID=1182545 RepID=A0A072P4M5_9EURO|nr:uncharacterized protein A1O9_08722 [Exophiala aquamarina CBS 119918]KEF55069.1 hypothetical protein A1O9_08722 [Exophiala aquamarina CBS 119918]